MPNARLIIILFSFLLSSATLFGQYPQTMTPRGVQEYSRGLNDRSSQLISRGMNNGLVLTIPDADRRLVEKVWTNYLRSIHGAKPKKVKKSDDMVAENAGIRGLPGDLYSRADEVGNNVQFHVWTDAGAQQPAPDPRYGFTAGYGSDAYAASWDLLDGFRAEVEREKVRQLLADEEKQLRKLERDLEQLKSANQRYHRDIEQAEKRIQEAKQNIVKNEQNQQQAVKNIEGQQLRVKEVEIQLSRIN